MKVKINPSTANGVIDAPPSKSLAHRMLICAGLSEGNSIVHNISKSEDVLATLDCLSALGATYTYENGTVNISGSLIGTDNMIMPCRECGSTLRFFIPIALLLNKRVLFTGSDRLLQRPLGVYEEICQNESFLFERTSDGIILSGLLKGGTYTIKGDISSQFITGLLFALPFAKEDSIISLIPPIESRSYINLTLQALYTFGIDASWKDKNTLYIKGNQKYQACETKVKGDYSNAAFLDALTYMGGNVEVKELEDNSLQGDRVYKEHFDSLKNSCPQIDISDCPDLGPILFTLASAFNGATFTGTHRLKIKESDRAVAMAEELSKFGANLTVLEDTVIIDKTPLHQPNDILCGHNDHRIVMSLVTLATRFGGIVSESEAVKKSYPDYFEVIKKLGIDFEEELQ